MEYVTIWFLDGGVGNRILNNTTRSYQDVYGHFPSVTKDLPKYLSNLGYWCISVEESFTWKDSWPDKISYGLRMRRDDATAFILRWG